MKRLGATRKAVTYDVTQSPDYLLHESGAIWGGAADGRPSLVKDVHACEASWLCPGPPTGT